MIRAEARVRLHRQACRKGTTSLPPLDLVNGKQVLTFDDPCHEVLAN